MVGRFPLTVHWHEITVTETVPSPPLSQVARDASLLVFGMGDPSSVNSRNPFGGAGYLANRLFARHLQRDRVERRSHRTAVNGGDLGCYLVWKLKT